PGVWGTDARHVYSKQQAWNANGKLLLVQNRKGAAKSSPIILDGETYKPLFPADYGIGFGEGNVSADGRYVVISDSTRMVVVDMDPRGPRLKPYPAARIGPVYTFDPCSLSTRDPGFCPN